MKQSHSVYDTVEECSTNCCRVDLQYSQKKSVPFYKKVPNKTHHLGTSLFPSVLIFTHRRSRLPWLAPLGREEMPFTLPFFLQVRKVLRVCENRDFLTASVLSSKQSILPCSHLVFSWSYCSFPIAHKEPKLISVMLLGCSSVLF